MAKLSTKKRNSLPKSSFGMPSQRKYPMNDKSHAANAKSRAKQQYNKGSLSLEQLDRINSMANKKLGKK